jgi:predicted aspartyl protease
MPFPGKSVPCFAEGRVCALRMRVLLLYACLALFSRPLFSQTPSSSLAAQSSVHTAAIELINDKPYVPVMVNGRGPFRFLIDTGTGGQALISPELADELALPVAGHARLRDPSGKGEQRSEILLVHSLKVAGVEFGDVRGIRHRLYGEDQGCEGVLGFTLFKDYLLTLDYPGKRVTLAPGALTPEAGDSVLAFRMPDGVPIVAMRIDGQHVETQIDSGGTGLSLPETVAMRLKFLSTPVAFGSGESLATRFQIKAARLRADVRMGRYAFRQAFVEINAAFPLVNFGSTPLRQFRVTFDQQTLLMRVEASQKILHLDASPTTMRLIHEPRREASDGRLVPVG